MQAAYVRTPMEYVIDQKVDFTPNIDLKRNQEKIG